MDRGTAGRLYVGRTVAHRLLCRRDGQASALWRCRRGGVYHNFGEQFAALENETSNGTIELRTTAGSAANLRLLTGEYLQLAIAQADLAQDAYNQTGIFAEEEDIRGFGAVAALYTEACQSSCGPTRTSSPSRTCRAKP